MDTESLIRALAKDARLVSPRMPAVLGAAYALAALVAALVFLGLLGPRPDIAAAAETPRFLFKFVVTLALATTDAVTAADLERHQLRQAQWPAAD